MAILQFLLDLPLLLQFILVVIFAAVVVIYLLLPPKSASILWYPSESVYLDPSKNIKKDFAGLDAAPEVEISLIAPAYNEKESLLMVKDTMKYLQSRKEENPSFTYELVIVDDGSKDNTTEIALQYLNYHSYSFILTAGIYVKQYGVGTVRVLTLQQNRGKGGAVKRGMLVGRGKYLLMVDADGATDIADLGRVLTKLKQTEKNGHGIVVGSRAHMVDNVVAKRSLSRNILMYAFHIFVKVVGVPNIKDTQCGFKLFTRKSAQALFSNLHVERWAFDVELLFLAQKQKIPVVEEPVNWREIEGSKLSPFASSVQMAFDLVRIRAAYLVGVWKVDKQTKRE